VSELVHSYDSEQAPITKSLLVSMHEEYKTPDTLATRRESSLSQRALNLTYAEYTVNATRILRTPSPLVAARPSILKKMIWAFNFVRGAIAVVYQALDIAEQKRVVPSVGLAINFLAPPE
jgi:hypothetical protein